MHILCSAECTQCSLRSKVFGQQWSATAQMNKLNRARQVNTSYNSIFVFSCNTHSDKKNHRILPASSVLLTWNNFKKRKSNILKGCLMKQDGVLVACLHDGYICLKKVVKVNNFPHFSCLGMKYIFNMHQRCVVCFCELTSDFPCFQNISK